MPELPEVETMRRGIAGVVGCRITQATRLRCKLRPIQIHPTPTTLGRRLRQRTIVATERLGKRVILRLDTAERLIFEPRMTGLVLVADPPNTEHLRFRLQLHGGQVPELLYWDRRGLGSVRLLREAEFYETFSPRVIGPDALDITGEQLQERLGSSARAVKVALLDQRAVAGIGNLYAAEILYLVGISPQLPCNRLARRQWDQVAEATRAVLAEAIRYEGSTLSDGTYRNALNKAGGYQNHHRVYDRAGKPCPKCHQPIQRIVQAQRATFYCPTCQPLARQRKK